MDRDCENCAHYKAYHNGNILIGHSCEKLECSFKPKNCEMCVKYENCPWNHKGCEWK